MPDVRFGLCGCCNQNEVFRLGEVVIGGERHFLCANCEAFVASAIRRPGGVMYANDPFGISHANHCECSRCEKGWQPQDVGTITADLPAFTECDFSQIADKPITVTQEMIDAGFGGIRYPRQ